MTTTLLDGHDWMDKTLILGLLRERPGAYYMYYQVHAVSIDYHNITVK